MRQIVLDTETTGLSPQDGHRVIEIGCVELIDRRLTGSTFHHYINPRREIEEEAIAVHGITNQFLKDKPVFADLIEDILAYIDGAELIIHNAPFDVGFLNHEFKMVSARYKKIPEYCQILDTLALARKLHPGQRNNLDALCKRYDVRNAHRDLHGALLDAEILALVYLAMTGGQVTMFGDNSDKKTGGRKIHPVEKVVRQSDIPVMQATKEELAAHQAFLEVIEKASGESLNW